jgi:hypothetical protein
MAGLVRGKIIVGDASGDPSALTVGAVNQVLKSDGTDVSWGADSGGLFSSYSIIQDQKTSGTAGGTFTSAAWRTRDLQTEVYDGIGVTLSTNEFTLSAGSYSISWTAPAWSVGLHQSRLYDVTGTASIGSGTSCTGPTASTYRAATNLSVGSLRVTVGVGLTNAYRIEHQCSYTHATNGFGVASGYGTEVYTQVQILKES